MLREKIKTERLKLNLSQEELSEEIFVSRVTVSNWETGKTYPDIESLLLLSKVFSVSVDYSVKEEVSDIMLADEMYEYGKLQGQYRIYGLLLIINAIVIAVFAGLNNYTYVMVAFIIMFIIAVPTIIIEKRLKKFNIEDYYEITLFLKGASLEEIKQNRKKLGKRKSKLLFFSLGLATYFIMQIIVTLIDKMI